MILAAAYVGPRAWAQETGGIRPTIADLRDGIREERALERTIRARKCFGARSYRWRYVSLIPAAKVKTVLYWQMGLNHRLRKADSRCATSTGVAAVIRRVFGPTAGAAIRVASCESHLYPRAVGAAGERGLFQIHPVHFGWLDEWRLFEPAYNSRIAYRMSRGGTDWSAWACQP